MKTLSESLKKSAEIATEFAEYLNNTPQENGNWGTLDENDDLPNEDYRALDLEFGDVTREMVCAYKTAFNKTRNMELANQGRDE